LSGYNINLVDKKIVIVGNGRLVGAPLYKMWQKSGLDVSVYDDQTRDLEKKLSEADVVVTATGAPRLIKSSMLKSGAVVIDAGTASDGGKIVGDIDDEVRARTDLILTPIKGGVGPLTIAALFDNVIQSARKIAEAKGQQDL
jgi:methylenetetrahydrofolate dehydrogenase (NADP+) / methenyltetrahydrofolate cyclohydrolase